MTMSLEHHELKADPEGAARELGVTLHREESDAGGEQLRRRVLEARLPRSVGVHARFCHEGLLTRLRKLFTEEVEVGSSLFDDHVFVVTDTHDSTAQLLSRPRAQTALLLLITPSRYVEVLGDLVRVVDEDARSSERDVCAELLALSALMLR
jgi:hypothetical protein